MLILLILSNNNSARIRAALIYSNACMATCSKCSEAPKALRLLKCVICFKLVCEKCAIRRYAKIICSEDCSKLLFFGISEEEE